MPDRLILCLDGTWNSTYKEVLRDDGSSVLKPTNPLKLARAVVPLDAQQNRQVVHYDIGVGALGTYPGLSNKALHTFDKFLGGPWGAGFEANVEKAANFLTLNYSADTEIYVFGFSRGAAQARALAHFIDWMGGLPLKADAYYVPLLYRRYLDSKGKKRPITVERSNGYVPANHVRRARIRFLGVWDTVMALGSRIKSTVSTSVANRAFYVPDRPAGIVDHAYHAISIDERRYDFRPEIWRAAASLSQVMEQRWFAGSHGNVGGSYGQDGMANCALHWMVRKATALGLEIDQDFLDNYGCYPQDQLGDPRTFLYRAIDQVRQQPKGGIRKLVDHPATANLELHKTVLHRFYADYTEHNGMGAPYRPQNLVDYLQQKKGDWDSFVKSIGLSPNEFSKPNDL